MKQRTHLMFKVCSKHKQCSFCGASNIPVVMEMHGGKAICELCIGGIKDKMSYENGEQPDTTVA